MKKLLVNFMDSLSEIGIISGFFLYGLYPNRAACLMLISFIWIGIRLWKEMSKRVKE